MAGISSKAAGKAENKKKFNGYEFNSDFDIDIYESFYRLHNSQIGRFLQVDIKAKNDESPYASMGNNPILQFDLLGDDFDIATNKESKEDVYSLSKNKNKKYIKISEEGKVTLDFGDKSKKEIDKILAKDEGLALINDLFKAKEKYLYEASDVLLARKEDFSKKGENMYSAISGNVNASNGGKDDQGSYGVRPKEGYDGQVVILPRSISEQNDGSYKPRSARVFHELAENFERTTNKVNYYDKSSGVENGAHQRAINRELNWSGRSITPGVFMKYYPPTPPPGRIEAIQKIIDNY